MSKGLYTGISNTIIYVWLPHTGSSITAIASGLLQQKLFDKVWLQKSVGHVALQVEDVYISPTATDWVNAPLQQKYFSYEQEAKVKKDADYIENITWLNTSAMLKLWKKMKIEDYDAGYMNCAYVCKALLGQGGHESIASQHYAPILYEKTRQNQPPIPGYSEFLTTLNAQCGYSIKLGLLQDSGIFLRNFLVASMTFQNHRYAPFPTPRDVMRMGKSFKFYEDGKFEPRPWLY